MVLDSFQESCKGQSTVQEKTGMNEYLDSHMEEHNGSVDEVEFSPAKNTELGAVPKTPLQSLAPST